MSEQQPLRFPAPRPTLNAVPVCEPFDLGRCSARLYRRGSRILAVVWCELEPFDVSEWSSTRGAWRWASSTLRFLGRSPPSV